jgi:hypothetical protein
MPTKDPITVVGVLATVLLGAGGAMLYLTPAPPPVPPPEVLLTSPFKELPPVKAAPPAPPTPVPKPPPPLLSAIIDTLPLPTLVPALSDADLAKLSPAERTRYAAMRKSLQNVLQQVQTLEQENNHLQHTLESGTTVTQQLDVEINKLRPPKTPTP